MRYVEDVAGVGRASYGSLAGLVFSYSMMTELEFYLDVLPVPQLHFSRVRIRRSNLGGGTFRV